MWIFWLIIGILLIIAEIMSQMLWALCLGLGAVCAMVAELIGLDMVWQIVIMGVSAMIFYFTVFPIFRKIQNQKSMHTSRTGMDALLGRKAVVTKEIHPGKTGRARIDGDNWQVVAPGVSETVHIGSEVVVSSYDSIILTVELVEKENNK